MLRFLRAGKILPVLFIIQPEYDIIPVWPFLLSHLKGASEALSERWTICTFRCYNKERMIGFLTIAYLQKEDYSYVSQAWQN